MVSESLKQFLSAASEDAKEIGFTTGHLNLQGYRRVTDKAAMPLPDDAVVEDVEFGGVPARWICASGADPKNRILYLHGGGYIAGGRKSHSAIAGWLSKETKCCVLLPEYRLAPEFRFPAALEDSVISFRWMQLYGPNGEGEAEHSFVVGDSAGGGLAVSLCLALRAAGDALPGAGVSICPWVNLDPETSRTQGSVSLLNEVAEHYTGPFFQKTNSYISPVLGDLSGFPPWLVQVGTNDSVYRDGLGLVETMLHSGSACSLEIWPDMPHVWHKYAPKAPEACAALESIGRYLNRIALST